MKKAYLMVGVSGCGKSSIVEKIVEHHAGESISVFSLDICRLTMFHKNTNTDLDKIVYADAFAYCNEHQDDFNKMVSLMWNNALAYFDIVIVDNTNLTRKSRARWVNDLRSKGFQIAGIEVFTPLQVVINRQASRGDKSVPESVVRSMFMTQRELLLGSEVDALVVVNGAGELKYPF